MKGKEERIINILKIAFGLMLVMAAALLFLGELFMPVENPTGSGECVVLEADWQRVFPDGTREAVELPGRCAAERGEVVRVETILPSGQENTWFCMRASQQDMQVYVGDELRQEYSTKETRLFGKDSVSAFVFFEVRDEDAGKILAIETLSHCEYSGFLNKVYVGDKFDIASRLIKECAVVLLVAFYMLIISSITVAVGVILRVVYKKKVAITYLGLGILQLSMTMICESRVRQFFLPNASIAAYVGFLLTILIPYPFMVYVSRIQKGRYEKYYKALSLCVAANFVISVLLQVCNILDLADTVIIAYGLLAVMIILMAITIGLDIIRGRVQEYGEVIFGVIAMLVVAVWEICINIIPELPYYGGVAQSFGLIILLFMSAFKTARDMLEAEQEKQMAIASGEAKTKFLANMSHEIRTPINTIIGMNEMILRENLDSTVEEYARNAQNASRLLLGLINDILDFSKIEAGKMDILETEYQLSGMLTDVIKGIQIKAESKELILALDVDETLPSVLKGDEIRIRQILNNLLSNAVKYTRQGTITLSVKSMWDMEDFVLCISVKDTGIGIKPEDLEKLFSSFQRLEEQRNRYIEGTGLGLNITKQLAELMGGGITVESEYGKGSCFTVTIPQQIIDDTAIGKLDKAYQRDTAAREAVQSKLYAPKAEILVVDDNEMNLAVVDALLKRTAIKLTLAHSGTECLELCKNEKYDLILMDHMMPEPDGIETLHLLRKDESSLNQNTDVIVLTANAIAGMAEMYIQEGFSDYLSKPIVPGELEDMISRHLPKDKLEKAGSGSEGMDCAVVEGVAETGDIEDVEDTENGNDTEEVEVAEGVGMVEATEKVQDIEDINSISYIDREMGLAYCSNYEPMYQEMLKMYCEQGEKYLQELMGYYEARDWKSYKIIVHAIKGTSLMIGAAAFSERAKSLEVAAADGNEEVLVRETERFFEEYRQVMGKIRRGLE